MNDRSGKDGGAGARRRILVILLSILLLAVVLRCVALWDLSSTPFFQSLQTDEEFYHSWASELASGTYRSSTAYQFAPLPAYVLAGLYKLFSPDPVYFRSLNVVLGVLACLFIYLLAAELFGPKAGLLAALFAALYEPFIFYSLVPLKTAMSVFLFAAAMYLFVVWSNGRRPGIAALLLGLVMGLLLNVRANAGILIPAMLVGGLWYMHRGRTEKAAMAAAASLFIIGLAVTAGPFVLHNWSVSGRPSLTTPQTGRALYSNNNPGNPTPYYRPTPFALAKPRLLAVQFTIEASRLSGRTLTPAEASRFWTAEVLNWAAKEPEAFARKQGYKLLALFNRNEMGDHYHIGCTGRFARFFSLPWLCFALLLPLGLGGAVLTWGRCSRCRALCLFAGLYGLTLVVFFINTRYRLPLMVVLIPLAAAGLLEFGRAVLNRRGRKVAVYLAVALVAVLVEFIPVPGAGDMTPYINSYAMSLYNAGRVDEAAVYWRRSVAADGAYSDYARISLASEALKAGNEETAWNMLLRVPDHSFVAALKYRLMGDILAGLGRPEKAVPYYSKSLQINAGQVEVRQNLIQALRKTDPAAAARQENTLRNILYFYEKAGLIE